MHPSRTRVVRSLLRRELAAPSPRRWAGAVAWAVGAVRRLPVVAAPLHLHLEITTRCNLACTMCEHSVWSDKGRDLPLADFVQRLEAAGPQLRSVDLTGIGEPLLHHDFEAMLAECARRGLRVRFNTNATLLSEQWAERIVGHGVDEVHVSFDGARKETFERLRVGGRFEKVQEGVKRLVAARRAAGKKMPWISIQMVLLDDTLAEVVELVELAAALGADAASFQGLLGDVLGSGAQNPFVTRPAEVLARLDAAERRAEALGIELVRPRPGKGPTVCPLPWTQAFVQVDGTVLPCCLYTQADQRTQIASDFGLGKLGDTPLAELWNDTPYRELRTALADGQRPGPCAGCPLPRGLY